GAAMVAGGNWAALSDKAHDPEANGRVIEPPCPHPPRASKPTEFLQLRKRVVRAISGLSPPVLNI
ncbi:MAG: hypothetical protein ACLPWS_19525, partial [Rhodomicrobium sp.]